jgi:transcriptional regulator with GAF, ATPase, and Fis domain/serine/threonine protein kinase
MQRGGPPAGRPGGSRNEPPRELTQVAALSSDGRTTLLRAFRRDGRSVILKVLDPRHCGERDVARLRREHEIGATLDLDTAVRPLGVETYEGMPSLVLEDWGGEPLDRFVGRPMPLERFLDLAIRIAGAVADVHDRGVVHKDLKPANILVDPRTFQVKLAEFGFATRLPREQQVPRPPELVEGSLPYMSPEQTGRMNRAVDSRADLYSLGATFYEMLTGRLPFDARDPLEWIHCHVARVPIPPAQLVPEIPATVSQVVMKLLAKMAEDRYQTARGLGRDLARCLEEWRGRGRIDLFPLGDRDVPDRLRIPQKLYGRDPEIAELVEVFHRVADRGTAELVLVSGYSGVGKSSLVHELQKTIVGRRGLFAAGKFDQHNRDVPYATIAQAFRQLVLDLLAEPDEMVAAWRQRLQATVAPNGQLIVDIVPELELLLGKQPPVADLPLGQARNRFHMTFRRFLGAFTREEHPLTLFLDDLQWTDSATLELLVDVLTHPETRHLLAIGAYRDNELAAAHALVVALDGVRAAGLAVHDLVLRPLSREHLGQLVADAMRRSVAEVEPLVLLLEEKTAGNPFFTIQFLTALEEDGLIRLDPVDLAWRCDIGSARARGYTDNVADLMVSKVRRLSPDAQEVVKLAACTGNVITAAALSVVTGRPAEETHRHLWELVREGLLLRSGETYRFSHDRVQQSAYALLPENGRSRTHLTIGRLLLAHTPAEELGERVFEIVDQLNRGSRWIEDRAERWRLADLDLLAALRAKASTAYGPAARLLAAGISMLPDDAWETRHELAYALHFERAQCEYLQGSFAEAERFLSRALLHARSLAEKADCHRLRIEIHTTGGEVEKAVDALLECLALFGLALERHPPAGTVQERYARLMRDLGDRRIEDLIDLAPMSNPDVRALLEALVAAFPAAYFFDLNLAFAIRVESARLSIEHGNSPSSPVAYSGLGAYLCPMLGNYREGYRFGKLGHDLVEKHGLLANRPETWLIFGYLCTFWMRHVSATVPFLEEALRAGAETGHLNCASYCACHSVTVLLARGDTLPDVDLHSERMLEFVHKARYGDVEDYILSQRRLIHRLRGLPSGSDGRAGDGLDERIHGRIPMAVCAYHVRRLQEAFLFGDLSEAVSAAARVSRSLWASTVLWECCEHSYYLALTLAALHAGAPPRDREEHLHALRAEVARHRVWAENCPENFLNRFALVSAELARVEGRELDAERSYEQAIRSARENGFVQNEALAYELASSFHRARGYEQIADLYLREARSSYARWGADGKVEQLERLHPQLVQPRSFTPTAVFAARSEQVDLLSVVKASQTISGKLEIERLIATLLEVALEQGGARKGYLLLARGGSLSIEAEAMLEASGGVAARALPSVDVERSALVPVSVIRRARRTLEPVILDDASADAGGFASDPYFSRTATRSVLCLPIVRQELAGLLYLENELVAGAFTPDRLTALSLLASQAAISTENALLLARERGARANAELLAEVGALLSESLDLERTLARLGPLCAGSLADWCVLDLVEGDVIRRVAGACADPSREPLLERLARLYPARRDSPHPAARCLREGKPVWMPAISDEVLRSLCVDEQHLELVRALGTRSAVVVPLAARGTILGALSLAAGTPGRYRRTDLALALAVAQRAALAIDNARLYREAQDAVRQRDDFLGELQKLKTKLEEENLYLREEIDADLGVGGIVGESDPLKHVLLRVRQVAPSDATVLIEGETGVGKELVARAIHDRSDRAKGPFLRVNCAALPAQIVESELFGHEAGAFTGAGRQRKGRFELAHGGTLFLDEIAEMPLELQAKLLRVLEAGEFERVGGMRTVRVDVRVIAATNRTLRAEVADGRFREDLFYRLNVFPLTVPPLRERREDISLLVRHFVPQLAARAGRRVREIPGPFVRALIEHDWPGNVRELRNVLERTVLLCNDGVLRLPEPLQGRRIQRARSADEPLAPEPGTGPTLEAVERQHIVSTLRQTHGQVSGPAGAASLLGMNANTLRSRMRKLGIRIDRMPG